MAKRIDRKKRRELERKHRKRDRKAKILQDEMMRRLDERAAEDMPPCSFPDCETKGTTLLIEKTSLALYKQTKDRKDLRLWVGCGEHYQTMAQGLKWHGVDLQIATGRALLHLGEVEEAPSGLVLPDGTPMSSTPESGPPEAGESPSEST